jgi:hypothetical protein
LGGGGCRVGWGAHEGGGEAVEEERAETHVHVAVRGSCRWW